MPHGYHGCYLRIDVSEPAASERVQLSDDVLRHYLGGSGLGARLLLEERGATADPLSPEAPLIFAFSPLVGSPLTTSAKFAVVSRSPLTGRFNDSLASSGFAIAGKHAGCDAIVIVGKAPRLSVLVIDDGEVRLEPADDVAGESCPVTEEMLHARLGANYRIASIGPAGERAVLYATILARRTPRRSRRQRDGARQQEHQGDRRARHAARRVGAAARVDRVEPRSIEAILRSGDGEVPRARHRSQSADVQPLRHLAYSQLPAGHFRRSAESVARTVAHRVLTHARKLRGVHDRM
jgi:aldehyde:ferredoxin oxidoreductase